MHHAVLDTMIHYEGASLQQITRVLQEFGIEEQSTANKSSGTDSPCILLPRALWPDLSGT